MKGGPPNRIHLFSLCCTFLAATASYAYAAPEYRSAHASAVHEIDVPLLLQYGQRYNCGPTVAAMVIGAYEGIADPIELSLLRDKLGDWSWATDAIRRLKIPGIEGGWTTPELLAESLNKFSDKTYFRTVSLNEDLPSAWVSLLISAIVADGRPLATLIQTSKLWPRTTESLHWVVVRGITSTHVILNDPADGTRSLVPIQRFIEAWKLSELFRTLPFISGYAAVVGRNHVTKELVASR
jgi:hypothetical protein